MFNLSSLMLRLVEEATNFNEIEEKVRVKTWLVRILM